MIILLFPSSTSLSNQSIVNQNYTENEALVSTVDFRVQSAVSWGRSISRSFFELRSLTSRRRKTFGSGIPWHRLLNSII